MRLFIGEKPSVAKAIAAVLGETGKGDGYIQCGNDKITWCFGHMLEMVGPDEYTPDDVPTNSSGRKIWRVDELPIIPSDWVIRPKEEAKKQLNAIGRLVKEADEIVNAGDRDREGQLLVDEVLEYFNCKKPVKRFWVSSLDAVSVQRGLDTLKDNSDAQYRGMADAARGRSRADWLIGMNMSRAYTLRAQRGGSRALLTIGRVQTPALAMVVNLDRRIENFKAVPFHTIKATIQHDGGAFVAAWQAKEDQPGLDESDRLVDTNIADGIVANVRGSLGNIAGYSQKAKKKAQPLTFALSDMTYLASKRFGYSADDVLKACQSLYETHKLTSYPRTDCAYLPESQHADAPHIMKVLKHVFPSLADTIDGADLSIKSKTWNDDKVTAHHGIIPTLHKGDVTRLSSIEKNIYELIVRAYIAQFYPAHEFLHTNITVDVAGETFTASGKQVTKNGWLDVYQSNEDEDEDDKNDEAKGAQVLPPVQDGDAVQCADATRRDSKTKPPARWTEGDLVQAMVNVHKYVPDSELKKLLRDGEGIGTEATRASIISELKRREYLETKGKHVISTTLGRSLIDALPEVVKSPVLTALYERMLKGVESGSTPLSAFVAKQEQFIREHVEKANDGAVKIAGGKEAAAVSDVHKCMSCGAGLSRRASRKKGQHWWGCSNFPTCSYAYPDIKGRPDYSKGRSREVKTTNEG